MQVPLRFPIQDFYWSGRVYKRVFVITLPGPTAFIPALVQSGFPTNRFVFEGFLPHKKGRKSRLSQLAEETKTIVFMSLLTAL